MKLTAVVADDEALARRKLSALLANVPWIEQIGEAADGAAAVEVVRDAHPDILFLDVRMPELSGVEVVQRLRDLSSPPMVIFTTAYDHYAVTAFELDAIDYLLKPFGAPRVMASLERARRMQRCERAATLARAESLLTGRDATAPLDRIMVRDGNAIVPITLRQIERIEAQDDYVMIHTAERRSLVSLRIRDLEARLPNPPFLRVHRSHIVNLDHVDRMVGLDDTRLEVRMKRGAVVPSAVPGRESYAGSRPSRCEPKRPAAVGVPQ